MPGDALTDTPKLGWAHADFRGSKAARSTWSSRPPRWSTCSIDAGLTYFDTAYVYEGSEEATGRRWWSAVRDSYTLASKIDARLGCVNAKTCLQGAPGSRVAAARVRATRLLSPSRAPSRQSRQRTFGYGITGTSCAAKKQWSHRALSSPSRSPQMLDELTSTRRSTSCSCRCGYADWEAHGLRAELRWPQPRQAGDVEPASRRQARQPPRKFAQILRDANPARPRQLGRSLCRLARRRGRLVACGAGPGGSTWVTWPTSARSSRGRE